MIAAKKGPVPAETKTGCSDKRLSFTVNTDALQVQTPHLAVTKLCIGITKAECREVIKDLLRRFPDLWETIAGPMGTAVESGTADTEVQRPAFPRSAAGRRHELYLRFSMLALRLTPAEIVGFIGGLLRKFPVIYEMVNAVFTGGDFQ